jgi:hypothetical protein
MESIKEVDEDGTIRYRNEKGELHREDGPAFEKPNGHKGWLINGRYHREDGPAVVWSNIEGWHYLNGKGYSKENWELEIIKIRLKRIKDL